jgi:hypothetical protein
MPARIVRLSCSKSGKRPLRVRRHGETIPRLRNVHRGGRTWERLDQTPSELEKEPHPTDQREVGRCTDLRFPRRPNTDAKEVVLGLSLASKVAGTWRAETARGLGGTCHSG